MRRLLIFALVAALTAPAVTLAHSGRTNAEGCHNNRKTGDYHCHKKKPKKVRTSARATARGVATIDRNCDDFATHEEAQEFFIQNGGPLVDPHDLDRDDDGIACESLQ